VNLVKIILERRTIMKKRIFIIFAALLLLSMAVPASVLAVDFPGSNWATCTLYAAQCPPDGSPLTVKLIGGQYIDVGSVTISNDTENVYVEYNVDADDWYLTEAHVAIADSLAGIPQKNGNPTPGQFANKYEYDIGAMVTNPDPYVIPLGDYDCDDELYIAAHAVVCKYDGECILQEETAWSGDEEDEPSDGPSTEPNPSIDVEKHVRVDPALYWMWYDADTQEDAPTAHYCVQFKFIVTNTGDVTLTNITLSDPDLPAVSASTDTLAPGESFTVQYPDPSAPWPSLDAEAGLNKNTATATGYYDGYTYADTDDCYYTGDLW
jgi:hypothetical protein